MVWLVFGLVLYISVTRLHTRGRNSANSHKLQQFKRAENIAVHSPVIYLYSPVVNYFKRSDVLLAWKKKHPFHNLQTGERYSHHSKEGETIYIYYDLLSKRVKVK